MLPFLALGGAAFFGVCSLWLLMRGSLPMNEAGLLLAATGLLFAAGSLARARIERLESKLQIEAGRCEMLSAQLEQQRSTVDTLADGLEVAVLICEPKANIVYANRKATELFRFERSLGKSVLAVTLSYELEQIVAEAFRSSELLQRELPFTYPEDRVGIARAWADPAAGRVFLAIQDITNLRRLERIRQDFVANVSHELRTPLSVIRAMSETLLDEERDSASLASKYLAKMIEEVDRLSLIANDLLVLSVAESNPVRKQACDLADLFRGTCAQLDRKARNKGLDLTFEGPAHLLVEANSAQMSQVALNLIDNAINYTSEGSVRVSVLDADPDRVEVRVTDSGLGIASEHLPRIFERFYRVDKGRSRTTGGTGLGLSIVKHIVESHGGKVHAESELHRGSTFIVELPRGNVEPSSELPSA